VHANLFALSSDGVIVERSLPYLAHRDQSRRRNALVAIGGIADSGQPNIQLQPSTSLEINCRLLCDPVANDRRSYAFLSANVDDTINPFGVLERILYWWCFA
jgi:hypothetical protein